MASGRSAKIMAMTPDEAAAEIARPIGSIGARFMFDPGTYAAAAEHGYSGLDFYFAGRCGVLGDAHADVATAALGFFERDTVATLWNQGIAVEGAAQASQRFGAACGEWGRTHFGADIDYAELCELADRVIAAAPIAGVSLFAGWRQVEPPSDDKGGAAHRLNLLREFRGGVHLIAVISAGVLPFEAVLAKGGPANAQLFGYSEPYPDVSHLAAVLDEVEETTNLLAGAPLAVLDDGERQRFVDLVAATRAGLT